eukprot:7753253-Ditylum_brightwellii.AAC.1
MGVGKWDWDTAGSLLFCGLVAIFLFTTSCWALFFSTLDHTWSTHTICVFYPNSSCSSNISPSLIAISTELAIICSTIISNSKQLNVFP